MTEPEFIDPSKLRPISPEELARVMRELFPEDGPTISFTARPMTDAEIREASIEMTAREMANARRKRRKDG